LTINTLRNFLPFFKGGKLKRVYFAQFLRTLDTHTHTYTHTHGTCTCVCVYSVYWFLIDKRFHNFHRFPNWSLCRRPYPCISMHVPSKWVIWYKHRCHPLITVSLCVFCCKLVTGTKCSVRVLILQILYVYVTGIGWHVVCRLHSSLLVDMLFSRCKVAYSSSSDSIAILFNLYSWIAAVSFYIKCFCPSSFSVSPASVLLLEQHKIK